MTWESTNVRLHTSELNNLAKSPRQGMIEGCSISAVSTAMQVKISPGYIRHLSADLAQSVATTYVTINTANGTNDRIDIITVDSSGSVGTVNGTPATEPVPASSADVVLARVNVRAAATDVQTADITDVRVDAAHKQETGTVYRFYPINEDASGGKTMATTDTVYIYVPKPADFDPTTETPIGVYSSHESYFSGASYPRLWLYWESISMGSAMPNQHKSNATSTDDGATTGYMNLGKSHTQTAGGTLIEFAAGTVGNFLRVMIERTSGCPAGTVIVHGVTLAYDVK